MTTRPRHRRSLTFVDYIGRGLMRTGLAFCVAVCLLAAYAGAMPRFS